MILNDARVQKPSPSSPSSSSLSVVHMLTTTKAATMTTSTTTKIICIVVVFAVVVAAAGENDDDDEAHTFQFIGGMKVKNSQANVLFLVPISHFQLQIGAIKKQCRLPFALPSMQKKLVRTRLIPVQPQTQAKPSTTPTQNRRRKTIAFTYNM